MTSPEHVAICTPTVTAPHIEYLKALALAAQALDTAEFRYTLIREVGNPYISGARATMLRKALDAGADVIVFIDHDMSFSPDDLMKLIETPGDVVAGLYRFKKPDVEYMGEIRRDEAGKYSGEFAGDTRTLVLRANRVPAGFLKVTRQAVAHFMRTYPHLCYGDPIAPHVDLFNHGAHNGVWWGEDYAFSRNWIDAGGDLWVIPDLTLTHHSADEAFVGNYHHFLLAEPGGANDPAQSETQQSAA